MKLMPRYNTNFWNGSKQCEVSPDGLGFCRISYDGFEFPFKFRVSRTINIVNSDYKYDNWLISDDLLFFSKEFDQLCELVKTMNLDIKDPKTIKLIELNLGV